MGSNLLLFLVNIFTFTLCTLGGVEFLGSWHLTVISVDRLESVDPLAKR